MGLLGTGLAVGEAVGLRVPGAPSGLSASGACGTAGVALATGGGGGG